MNNEWFEWYAKQSGTQKKWASYRNRHLCPCSFMPTLGERGGFEICPICFLEDDGQDTVDAGIVRGGPNHDYSLKGARSNFVEHFTMYRPSDIVAFDAEQKTMASRKNLYEYFVKAINTGSDEDWKKAISAKSDD